MYIEGAPAGRFFEEGGRSGTPLLSRTCATIATVSTRSGDPLPRNRTTGAFERRVARDLRQWAPPEAPLVVACSGGPDSIAALMAVARGGWSVYAAHFDHRLRASGETAADRATVERLAGLLGVPVLAGAARQPTSGASEESARAARYRWLARACGEAGAAHCVTGHTLDDQAETVLLHLARGSGLSGAAGMAGHASWPLRGARRAAQLSVVRPLLGVRRTEVERYLDALGLEARHDPSNEQMRYARNRVRLHVLPELERVHGGATQSLAQFATLARRDEDALEGFAAVEFAQAATRSRNAVALKRRALSQLPAAIAARVLRRAARELGIAVNASQLDALARAARRRGSRVDLAGGRARSDGVALHIERCSRAARTRSGAIGHNSDEDERAQDSVSAGHEG